MVDNDLANVHNQVSLTKDIGPHSFTDIEWWYCFAFLNGDKGGRYAVMSAFYQAGELPILKGHYLIFSFIDLNNHTSQSFSFIDKKLANNFTFINTPLYLLQCPKDVNTFKFYKSLFMGKLLPPHQWLSHGSIEKDPTRLLYDKSSMIFNEKTFGKFEVTLVDDSKEVKLEFNSRKPVSLIGGDGKPDKLYYYSFTRNEVKGCIKEGNSVEYVTGEGWFDHQWGYLGDLVTKTGWNWLGLQLEDGRELLINEFRTIKTGDTFSPMANIIEADGTLKLTRHVTLEPSNYWQSPLTNAVYPLNWAVTIPEFNMVLDISADFKEQEMPVIAPLNAIWEGTCSVLGKETKSTGQTVPIKGRGFLELVGYANFKC